jgi:hypothetical protein
MNQLDWTTNFKVTATYPAADGSYLNGPWPFASRAGAQPDSILVGETSIDETSHQITLLTADLVVQSTLPMGGNQQSMATLDLNGDGLNDLAVGGQSLAGAGVYTNLISLFLNDANGGFMPGALYASETTGAPSSYFGIRDLASGDFYGDGSQQLSVGMVVYTPSVPNGFTRLDLYPLAGDGGLAAPLSPVQVPGEASHWAGDFNGDGKADILFWNQGTPAGAALTVTLSNGGGQFAAPTSGDVAVDGGYYSQGATVVADFNGDGRSDLAIGNPDSTISVEISDNQGTLGPPMTVATQPPADHYYYPSLVAGDFNGDGHQDLLQVNGCCGYLMLFLGVGDGTFLPPIEITAGSSLPAGWSPGLYTYPLATTLDRGNGRPDLALSYSYVVSSRSYQGVALFHNGCK